MFYDFVDFLFVYFLRIILPYWIFFLKFYKGVIELFLLLLFFCLVS